MVSKTVVAPLVVVCWALSLFAEAPDDKSVPAAPAAPKKRELGAWWQKNALEYKPMPSQWLFHADGTISYMNASGNTSGSTVDAAGNVELRKHRITSTSFVQISRKNMTYGFSQGTVDYVERTLREQVDFSCTDRVKLVAGIEGYRNTLMFMDKRLNVYAGVGAALYRQEKQQVTFTGGIGHAAFSFDRDQMMRVNPSQVGMLDTNPSSGGGLVMQTWSWRVSPRFSFGQDAAYMKYFLSDLGYRAAINLNGNVPVNKHFSFNLSYRFKRETNTIIKALRVEEQDRMFLMGIRVSI